MEKQVRLKLAVKIFQDGLLDLLKNLVTPISLQQIYKVKTIQQALLLQNLHFPYFQT